MAGFTWVQTIGVGVKITAAAMNEIRSNCDSLQGCPSYHSTYNVAYNTNVYSTDNPGHYHTIYYSDNPTPVC